MTRPEPEALALDPGYGITELGEQHWTLDDVYRRIDDARSWWVITVRRDGRPHAAPVWGVAVDDRIVFSSDPKAAKSANLATNPNIVVHLESGDEVVIVEGTVRQPRYEDLPERLRRPVQREVLDRDGLQRPDVRLLRGGPPQDHGVRRGRLRQHCGALALVGRRRRAG